MSSVLFLAHRSRSRSHVLTRVLVSRKEKRGEEKRSEEGEDMVRGDVIEGGHGRVAAHPGAEVRSAGEMETMGEAKGAAQG